jgi:hypothetical protein
MTVGTFNVQAALKQCFNFETSKGTRLSIFFGIILVGVISLVGAHVAELVAPHYTLYDVQHTMPLAPFRVRVVRVLAAILAQFFSLPILAGVFLLALHKQQGKEFNVSTLFSSYNKLPQFFTLALVLSTLLAVFTPGDLNLLGLYSTDAHVNLLLIILLNIPVIIFMQIFMNFVPLIIAEKEVSAIDAIKYSIFFMLKYKNWLKFILFQLAVAALFLVALIPAFIAAALTSTGIHVLALLSIVFAVLSLTLILIFYPMMIHGYSYIYNCITASFYAKADS